MRQILQNLRTGEMDIAELPCPRPGRGQVLVQTRASLISAGTERMLVEFSQANVIAKARQQPEKVKQVLDKMRTDGLLPTLDAVFRKLDQPLPLGYSSAGVALEVGPGIHDIEPGNRAACNGPHAEVVCVPRNLCAKIPDNVRDEQAAFTVLGSIALQGVRLAAPTLGEKFMVFGVGLVGLLTVQLLQANGCEVLAVDINAERLRLAESFGAQVVDAATGGDPVVAAQAWTDGQGVDGVLITASTKTDEIVHQAAQACRKRGRIVLVGVVGLNLRRSDFYEKELSFQVSCSYGPGRYDEAYEQAGHDYPRGYVRWTEQRNFEAVLNAMATGRLRVDELITHRFPLDDAISAYEAIQNDPSALGVILEYPEEVDRSSGIKVQGSKFKVQSSSSNVQRSTPVPSNLVRLGFNFQPCGSAVVGIIGAGNYAKSILLPALSKTPAHIAYVADIDGAAAHHVAKKFGAEQAVTDYKLMLDDTEVNAVFVVVGHHLHARFVCEALQASKHVFVEKPLCLNRDELAEIVSAASSVVQVPPNCAGRAARAPSETEDAESSTPESAIPACAADVAAGRPNPQSPIGSPQSAIRNPQSPILMVGFNRRFSPHIAKMKELLSGRGEPLCMNATVNAGAIPANHWTQDPERGGGRIVGEGCHFIDLLAYLADCQVNSVSAMMVGDGCAVRGDKMSIVLGLADGSIGTVNYFSNGSKSYPKEMLEVFSDGRVLRMENFRVTRGYGFRGFKGFKKFNKFKTWRQDKGHRAEIAAFVDRVANGGEPLIPFEQIENVTLASFAAVESAKTGKTIGVGGR